MARRDRDRYPPFIPLGSVMWAHFRWFVKLEVGSSGYVRVVTVDAEHYPANEVTYGSAWVEVEHGDDVQLAIQACLVEASAMSCEPPLFGAREAVRRLYRADIYGR
jgi:hypothetical protein